MTMESPHFPVKRGDSCRRSLHFHAADNPTVNLNSHRILKRRRYETSSSNFAATTITSTSTTTTRGHNSRKNRRRRKKILFIGQAPGPTQRMGDVALMPLAGCAGKRLSRLAGFRGEDELWAHCDRCNLLQDFPGRREGSVSISDRNGAHNRGVGFVYDSSGDAVLSFRIESKLHYSSGDIFPINEARAAAAELESSGMLNNYDLIVLLGLNVARAFELSKKPALLESFSLTTIRAVSTPATRKKRERTTQVLVFPHPSGVSHFWNCRKNIDRAREVIRGAFLRVLGPMCYHPLPSAYE